jgi:aspartate ammonia-lyase
MPKKIANTRKRAPLGQKAQPRRPSRSRTEKDSLGRKSVPARAYYGIQTQRAVENFPISGLRAPSVFIEATAQIKKAAARANMRLGLLDRRRGTAIVRACDEILSGKLHDQFIVDVFQMGAGTSFHMNMNEVLANRAEELLGGRLGRYRIVHPNDHVNRGQSTNDVYPTAMRLAALELLRREMAPALRDFERALARKGRQFDKILKSGRTHLQDAVPIRLGQEFAAYASAVRQAAGTLDHAGRSLLRLGIGGTAVGTGLNAHPRHARLVTGFLAAQTGFELAEADDLREAMQSLRPFADVSAALRNLALELIRIANDLRLLSSGPRTGLAEICLPAVAPGSSIMPGKVNPSMLEMLNQVSFQVMGCDLAVSAAVQAGQLELNVMMPVVAFNILFMMKILAGALREVRARSIEEIQADAKRCRAYAGASLGLATAVSPLIGYAAAAKAAQEALRTGESVADVLRKLGILDDTALERLMDPAAMTEPRRQPLSRNMRGKQRSGRSRPGRIRSAHKIG